MNGQKTISQVRFKPTYRIIYRIRRTLSVIGYEGTTGFSRTYKFDDIQVALSVTRLKERTDDYQAFERVLHNIFHLISPTSIIKCPYR